MMYCAYNERAHDKIVTSNELGMNIACGGYMVALIILPVRLFTALRSVNVFVTTGNMRCYLLTYLLP